jgi:hypothetical protein
MSSTEFEIPKECKAGVVHNEGPDFELKVEMVPVPEPGNFPQNDPYLNGRTSLITTSCT